MKPLQSIAMGLLVVGLTASFGEYDALPDPLGWVLVLAGVAHLPADLGRRGTLGGLAALAGVVAVPLWVPALARPLDDLDASLAWALTLPQLGFVVVLCAVLAARATVAGDRRAASRLRLALGLTVVVAVLPAVVLGAGFGALATPSAALAVATLALVVWQLFALSGRPWALPRGTPDEAGPRPVPGRP